MARASIDPNHHKAILVEDSITGDPLPVTGSDLVNSNPIHVAIVDNSGSQISSFGGGTQYTEGDTDATITGTAIMWEDTGNTLKTVNAADPLPVEIVAGAGSGGTASADDADFTAGTTSGTPAMGVYESTPTSVTDGDMGIVGITANRELKVSVTSGSTSGTQYTEGDTDATITGTASLMEGAANALVPLQGTVADGLLVNLGANNDVTVSGTVTANLSAVDNAVLDDIAADTESIKTAVEIIDNAISGTEMQVDVVTSALPTGAATSANQTTIIGHVDGIEGLLTTIDADTGNLPTIETNTDFGTVTGGGTETGALRVTIANNSTGVLSVDDNGSTLSVDDGGASLTVDGTVGVSGTVAVTQSGTWDEVGINDSGNSITVDAPTGTPVNVQIGDGTRQATVRDTGSSDSLNVAITDASGNQITSFGGGTEYTEDAAAAADPVGGASILVRSDTPATITSTDGDNVAQRGTNYGAAYVQLVTSSGSYIDSVGGGTQYTEGDTDATITGTAMMMEGAGNALVAAQGTAADGLLVNLGANNDVTVTGTVAVTQSGTWDEVGINDSGNSITVDDGGTTLSIDDGGGAITVDGTVGVSGTVTVDSELPTAAALADNTANPTVPAVGAFNMVYDGSTWDRAPGTSADGLLVNLGTNNDVTVTGTVTANLAAGTNNIGDVDVVSSALPTGASTSANQTTIIGHLDGVEGLLTTIDADTGNLPTIETNTDFGTVTGGGTETGALRVTIANNSTGVLSVDDNGSTISIDDGAGSITVDGTITANLAAGTNNIGDVDVLSISAGSNLIGDVGLSGARTSGGTTPYKNLDVDETEDEVKGTAGQVYWIQAINTTAAPLYLKFYNATAASVTVGTTTPVLTFPVPANADSDGAGFVFAVPNGIAFSTAITIAATTGVADNDVGAPGANALVVNLGYA